MNEIIQYKKPAHVFHRFRQHLFTIILVLFFLRNRVHRLVTKSHPETLVSLNFI